MNALSLLQMLLPMAQSLIGTINKIKAEDPEAWAAVQNEWKDAVAGWKALDE